MQISRPVSSYLLISCIIYINKYTKNLKFIKFVQQNFICLNELLAKKLYKPKLIAWNPFPQYYYIEQYFLRVY